jgi:hypothetical protein
MRKDLSYALAHLESVEFYLHQPKIEIDTISVVSGCELEDPGAFGFKQGAQTLGQLSVHLAVQLRSRAAL